MPRERVAVTNHIEPVQPTDELKRGALVRNIRQSLNLSEEAVATAAGLTQGCLAQIEIGKVTNPSTREIREVTKPSARTIRGLARALGLGINFWEEPNSADVHVFLNPYARSLNEILQSNHDQTRQFITFFVHTYVTQVEEPHLIYIDHFPSGERLADKILRLRQNKGLSQRQAGESSHLSQPAFLSLEHGPAEGRDCNPPIQTLKNISEALGSNLLDLLDIKILEPQPDPTVVLVDRFFRSREIPPETKKKVWQALRSLVELQQDPYLNKPSPIPQLLTS